MLVPANMTHGALHKQSNKHETTRNINIE